MRKTAAALLFFVAATAFAGDDDLNNVRRWNNWINDSTKALRQRQYDKSLRISKRITREMLEYLGPGQASANALAVTLVHRAAAEAGLGNRADAEWYWRVATSLDRSLKPDLAPLGEGGKPLTSLLAGVDPDGAPARTGLRRVGGTIAPPKLVRRVDPVYPNGALSFAQRGQLRVEVVIDENGRVRSPSIRQGLSAPTLSFAALEAVKQWQFEPSVLDGAAVPVVFNLTVNYELK